MDWDEISHLDFSSLIVSAGAGKAGSRTGLRRIARCLILNADVPVLGVRLGHQGIACFNFGGDVSQVDPVHGEASGEIIHDGDALFRGIPQRFSAVRYHSLAVMEPLPAELRKIAWSSDGMVMALRHVTRPIWGVQFHPESVCTEYGAALLQNFLSPRSRLGLYNRPTPARPQPQASVRGIVRTMPLPRPVEVLFRELFSHERYAFWLDSSLAFSYMGASGEAYKASSWSSSICRELPFPFHGRLCGLHFGYEWGSEAYTSISDIRTRSY